MFQEDVIDSLIQFFEANIPSLAGKISSEYPSFLHKAELPCASLTLVDVTPLDETATEIVAKAKNEITGQITLTKERAKVRIRLQLDVWADASRARDQWASQAIALLIKTKGIASQAGVFMPLSFLGASTQSDEETHRQMMDLAVEYTITEDELYYFVRSIYADVKDDETNMVVREIRIP